MKSTPNLALRENENYDPVSAHDMAFNARQIDQWAWQQMIALEAILKEQNQISTLLSSLGATLQSLEERLAGVEDAIHAMQTVVPPTVPAVLLDDDGNTFDAVLALADGVLVNAFILA